jgi:hypothetical protein
MQHLPPYVSWSAFLKALDVLGPRCPDKLDAASFSSFSASTAGQMMQAFRFLRLITTEGAVLPDLSLLVEHSETRPAVIGKLLRQSYVELFGATTPEVSVPALEQLIARTGLSPATQRKAITFFLNAAAFAGLPVAALPKSLPPGPGPQAPSVPNKKSLSIELASGGTIEIIADFDPLRIEKDDREFIFDLVDRLRGYQDRRRQEKEGTQTGDDNDREVPF